MGLHQFISGIISQFVNLGRNRTHVKLAMRLIPGELHLVVGRLDAEERRAEEGFGVGRSVRFVQVRWSSRALQNRIGQGHESTVFAEPLCTTAGCGLFEEDSGGPRASFYSFEIIMTHSYETVHSPHKKHSMARLASIPGHRRKGPLRPLGGLQAKRCIKQNIQLTFWIF